ncbi:hypothetical protein [uncultured Sphingomonas sp.]|uniref:hypothetical protein n=1 Tax=uncultured Sphingomonas sp. TaxID=158754 RepID=UPI0025EB06F6|nr:hypothetical protein [uncultured Sphingomonas sp.]
MTPRLTDHGTEIALLALIAIGVMIVTGIGLANATADRAFDPSAYLVVLTLIVGAIKERWTQRSADQANRMLGASVPAPEPPVKTTVEGE